MRYTVADGSGPVCLIHAGGPGVSPHYMRMPAVERHVRAVYLDPVGTGDSGRLPTHPQGYSMEFYRHCAEKAVDHLGREKVYFLGHSFGGFVAQDLALHRPDLLAGIILYDTAPLDGPLIEAEADRQVDAFARRFSGHPALPALLAAYQEDPGPSATDQDATRWLRGIMPLYFADYWKREDEFGPAVQTMSVTQVTGHEETFDSRGKLHDIHVPTLIIVGRYDFVCPPVWAEQMHRDIPGSELVSFEQSGHLAHLEEPEAFAAAIGKFISAGEQ
jgi:pimeloyl-ACP methyl ester carboxylesterase